MIAQVKRPAHSVGSIWSTSVWNESIEQQNRATRSVPQHSRLGQCLQRQTPELCKRAGENASYTGTLMGSAIDGTTSRYGCTEEC